MSPTTLPSARQPQGLQGRHVLLVACAFFGVVLAVNGVMLHQALSTHSGLVAQEPYRKGLAYNTRIAADERQAALGWTTELTAARNGQVVFAVADGHGRPVSGLTVAGMLGRPSSGRSDVRLRFAGDGAGRYIAEAGAIDAGTWQIDVEVRSAHSGEARAQEPIHRTRRRLWLKP